MDDWNWTMSDTLSFLDRIAEEKANAEFLAACKNGNFDKIEFELQHGRDPNLPVLKKVPLEHVKNNPEAVELLLKYGAITEISGSTRNILPRLQTGQAELEKRYTLCRETHCKTIMEYNQTAGTLFKKYFMVFPFVHTLTAEECKILFNIASKGRAADIHVAIGSVDENLPAELEMCCQEKISAPIGANTLLSWYCPFYSVTAFQFLSKFKNEQKKNNISTKTQRKTTRRKSALEVKDYSLDKKTLLVLPVIKGLLSKINSSWIERTICDEESCIVFFKPNKENIKPWLEICLFNGKQHIDFEIVTASDGDEKFLDYETFVTKQNENKVLNKIWSEINKLYRS